MRGFDVSGDTFAYKIPDQPTGHASWLTRFNLDRPFDLFAHHNGAFHAVELKQATSATWSLSRLPLHQELALLQVARSGGNAWVCVNFRWRPSTFWLKARAKKRRTALPAMNVAYFAPIASVVHARAVECWSGLPLEWWEDNGTALPLLTYLKKQLWDPAPLLGSPALEVKDGHIKRLYPVRSPRLWDLSTREQQVYAAPPEDPVTLLQDIRRRKVS